MTDTAQNRAVANGRKRLARRGMGRFEVVGLDTDRELIRSLARRLAANGPDAARLRASMQRALIGAFEQNGGVLAALRRSPLVGANLDLARQRTRGRKIAL